MILLNDIEKGEIERDQNILTNRPLSCVLSVVAQSILRPKPAAAYTGQLWTECKNDTGRTVELRGLRSRQIDELMRLAAAEELRRGRGCEMAKPGTHVGAGSQRIL